MKQQFLSRLTRLGAVATFTATMLSNQSTANATTLIPLGDTTVNSSDGMFPSGDGMVPEIKPKLSRNTSTNASYTSSVGVIRFKIKPTDIAKHVELMLDVSTFSEAVTCDFRLWGLSDAAGTMQSFNELLATWSVFNGVINTSATGVNTTSGKVFDGNPATTDKDPLATITLTQADLGKTVKFSGAALADFINADNDGNVTFLVTRTLRSNSFQTGFAARGTTTHSPPRLVVDARETYDASADTYARYGDATVHGAESNMPIKNAGVNSANTRRGVVRFDVPVGIDAEKASVSFDVVGYSQNVGTMPSSINFFVYGIPESSAAESFNEATANEATFVEELNGSSDGVNNWKLRQLGKFNVKSSDVGKTVSFASSALSEFISTDTNGKISLIVARAEYTPYLNFSFATKEHSTLQGPRLDLTQGVSAVAAPTMRFVFRDLDADGDQDLVLVVDLPGGGGYYLYDPFAIAEAVRVAGYDFGVGTDFWDSLSVSQQSNLLLTVSDLIGNVGPTVEATELHQARTGLPEGRTYKAEFFSGTFEGTQPGNGVVAAALVSSSASNSLGYTQVDVLSGNAGAMITSSGMAFGAEANVFVMTAGVGDPSGSTAAVSVSGGIGMYGELKYGQNGQYGASVPLVFIPVGVTVYVKGSDAVAAWNTVQDAVCVSGEALYDVSKDVANWGIDWSQDVAVTSVNLIDDSAVMITQTGGVAILWTCDAGHETTVWLTGTTAEMGTAIQSGYSAISSSLSSATSDAASTLTSWSSSAGSAVVSTYDTSAGWVSGATSALDDLAEGVGNTAGEVINDVEDAVECNALWCF